VKTKQLANGGIRVEARKYLLELRPGDAMAYLEIKGTHLKHLFFPGGACNPVGKRDETGGFGPVKAQSGGGVTTLTFAERSSLWKEKRHVWICREESIEAGYSLRGSGDLSRAQYFRGYLNGEERGMGSEMDELYSTCPNFQEKLFYHPGESFILSAGNALELPVAGQALASPCYCVGLHDRRDKAFWSVGLATLPGQYTWDSFEWNPPALIPPTPFMGDSVLGGGFAAVYDGKLKVRGSWQSPRLVMTFARDRYDVLRRHLDYCQERGYLPRPARRKPVAWWRAPIYCTWHDQIAKSCATTQRDGVGLGLNASEFCTRKLTDRWVRLLEKNHCKPGIVILDAAWAVNLNSGEPDVRKWPAMRQWVEECHQRDIRVFVWSAAWAIEGLPAEECITCDGKPVACDITHPKYVARFREMIRRWFSDAPDGLNADGVKMDGLLSLPTGAGLRNHGGVWGLELQRLYLKNLWEAAKEQKPEACVSTFALNPLLAEYTDMVRIADMYTGRLTAHETMRHRAALYRMAQPQAIIDTDGQLAHYTLPGYNAELAEQARIGSPTLYAAELVYRKRFFLPLSITRMTKEDYREFARVFAAHRKAMARVKPSR